MGAKTEEKVPSEPAEEILAIYHLHLFVLPWQTITLQPRRSASRPLASEIDEETYLYKTGIL